MDAGDFKLVRSDGNGVLHVVVLYVSCWLAGLCERIVRSFLFFFFFFFFLTDQIRPGVGWQSSGYSCHFDSAWGGGGNCKRGLSPARLLLFFKKKKKKKKEN